MSKQRRCLRCGGYGHYEKTCAWRQMKAREAAELAKNELNTTTMPVRKDEIKEQAEGKLIELAQKAVYYKRLKTDIDKIEKEAKDKGDELKTAVKESGLYEVNGNHKEVTAPLGDGLNEVFIQVQGVEIVKPVANILDLVKEKLGDDYKDYVIVQEVLHPNALESLLEDGKISADDVLDWTTTTQQERLIVKINKKKK